MHTSCNASALDFLSFNVRKERRSRPRARCTAANGMWWRHWLNLGQTIWIYILVVIVYTFFCEGFASIMARINLSTCECQPSVSRPLVAVCMHAERHDVQNLWLWLHLTACSLRSALPQRPQTPESTTAIAMWLREIHHDIRVAHNYCVANAKNKESKDFTINE